MAHRKRLLPLYSVPMMLPLYSICVALVAGIMIVGSTHPASARYRDYALGTHNMLSVYQGVWDPTNEWHVFCSGDSVTPRIYAWDPRTGVMTWLAGSSPAGFSFNVHGQQARTPVGYGITMYVKLDGSLAGYVIPDIDGHAVGALSNVAPFAHTFAAGVYNTIGDTLGTGSAALFNYPCQLCYHRGARSMVLADSENHKLKMLVDSGTPTTLTASLLAGAGGAGAADGVATAAQFNGPFSCVMLPSTGAAPAATFVTEYYKFSLRRLVPVTSAGTVTTVFSITDGASPGLGIDAYEAMDGTVTLLLTNYLTAQSIVTLRLQAATMHTRPVTPAWPTWTVPASINGGNWFNTYHAHFMINGTVFITRFSTPTIRVFQRTDLFFGTHTRSSRSSTKSGTPVQSESRTRTKVRARAIGSSSAAAVRAAFVVIVAVLLLLS